MPFTLSHPAAVVPIHTFARWASLSALVIGSMAPDFAYFIPYTQWGGFSHSLAGIAGFCIPVGLLVFFAFHGVVKKPMWRVLPWAVRSRLQRPSDIGPYMSLRALLAVVVSIALGALTHVAWDGFTHRNGGFVRIFDWLSASVTLGHAQVPAYKLLQHASSILGLAALASAGHRWFKKSPVVHRERVGETSRTTAAILLFFAIAGVGGALLGFAYSDARTVERVLFHSAIYGIGAVAGTSLLYSIAAQLTFRFRRSDV